MGVPWEHTCRLLQRASSKRKVDRIPNVPEEPVQLALAFVLTEPMVDTVIVSTNNLENLLNDIHLVNHGPFLTRWLSKSTGGLPTCISTGCNSGDATRPGPPVASEGTSSVSFLGLYTCQSYAS